MPQSNDLTKFDTNPCTATGLSQSLRTIGNNFQNLQSQITVLAGNLLIDRTAKDVYLAGDDQV
jgi:hypothetical protein